MSRIRMASFRRFLVAAIAGGLAVGLIGGSSSLHAADANGVPRKAREFSDREIARLVGGRVRLVWVQATDGRNRDVFAESTKFRLMAYDSSDGKGERVLLARERNYCKPLLTPDGNGVVYTDRVKSEVRFVNFDGSGDRKLTDGWAADVWMDPNSEQVWVYYQKNARNWKGEKAYIHRTKLDDPNDSEVVWNKTGVTIDNFQLSRDGNMASGLFPWPHGGVAFLPNGRLEKRGRGCWTSMAPDSSGMTWIFDGPHRNVMMMPPGSGRGWKVNINDAPGIGGYEVYHPRWSNHVRYLVMTGPYKVGGGANRIRAGGPLVEVYLGRFESDFSGVEKWVKITHNRAGDFYPDAWIEGGDRSTVEAVLQKSLPEWNPAERSRQQWPGSREGLVFIWDHVGATNQIVSEKGDTRRTCNVVPRGRAIYGRYGSMDTAGGSFVSPQSDKPLLEACRKSNQLTIEAAVYPGQAKQDGPARIISFSKDSRLRNFTLGQSGDKLVLRLRTPKTGKNGIDPQVTLGTLKEGQSNHVVVSYSPGLLYCYIDGKLATVTRSVGGGFSNWEKMHLVFGDEYDGDRDWSGRIEGVCIYSRFMGPGEARRKYKLWQKKTAGRARNAPKPLTFRGKLVEVTQTPDPKDIGDYRRALAVYTYEVEKVIRGEYEGKRILVAHWVILDRKQRDPGREVGEVYQMTVEPYDQREELEGERFFSDSEEFDLEMYYDPSR